MSLFHSSIVFIHPFHPLSSLHTFIFFFNICQKYGRNMSHCEKNFYLHHFSIKNFVFFTVPHSIRHFFLHDQKFQKKFFFSNFAILSKNEFFSLLHCFQSSFPSIVKFTNIHLLFPYLSKI